MIIKEKEKVQLFKKKKKKGKGARERVQNFILRFHCRIIPTKFMEHHQIQY